MASAVCPGYASDTQSFVKGILTNPPTVVVVSYEINVLLVCYICFCPTDEQMPALAYERANLSWSFGLYLCVYVVCFSEIIASESYISILYSMYVLCFHICTWWVTNLLLKFLLTSKTISNTAFGSCAVATSIFPLSDPRDDQFSSIHLCLLSLVLGLAKLWTSPCTLD